MKQSLEGHAMRVTKCLCRVAKRQAVFENLFGSRGATNVP
jgi:hypothetical protein